MEHGLKDVEFYIQKHIVQINNLLTPALDRDMPLGAPSFLDSSICIFVTLRQ